MRVLSGLPSRRHKRLIRVWDKPSHRYMFQERIDFTHKRYGEPVMLSLTSGFNYFLCSEPVTLRYCHSGLRNYIKSQLHRDPTNGDIYIFLSRDSHRVRLYYFHHQGEILTEKILRGNHFVEPVFDEKKGCYRISWEAKRGLTCKKTSLLKHLQKWRNAYDKRCYASVLKLSIFNIYF